MLALLIPYNTFYGNNLSCYPPCYHSFSSEAPWRNRHVLHRRLTLKIFCCCYSHLNSQRKPSDCGLYYTAPQPLFHVLIPNFSFEHYGGAAISKNIFSPFNSCSHAFNIIRSSCHGDCTLLNCWASSLLLEGLLFGKLLQS